MESQIAVVMALISATLITPPTTYSQTYPGVTQINYDFRGSVPPVSEWYSCINDLRRKPFDQKQADKCLQSILSRPHLTKGRVIAQPEKTYTQVSFVLESPSLTLSKVDFGLPTELEMDFERFTANDVEVLRA